VGSYTFVKVTKLFLKTTSSGVTSSFEWTKEEVTKKKVLRLCLPPRPRGCAVWIYFAYVLALHYPSQIFQRKMPPASSEQR